MIQSIKYTVSLAAIACLLVSSLSGWSFFNFGSSQDTKPDTQQEQPKQRLVTLMINPAGDANTSGRSFDETFERALTLRCAQELKTNLEATHNVRVLLTRFPGETVDPLQNASFANRMQVNLYLSLHFYKAKESHHPLFFYYYSSNPTADLPVKRSKELVFYPYNQAYKMYLKESKEYAQELYTFLKQDEKEYHLVCYPPLGIACKPLIGILAPALMCEIGIDKKEDVKQCILALNSALGTLINRIEKNL
ncbi:N-acetylmuramoyl-L-alanine amidase [Candidatus Dependentiae bacterium]|nr:N-acetylmuramoyl-L-alanine amidase [Candidatus Dependentiae bacterium]